MSIWLNLGEYARGCIVEWNDGCRRKWSIGNLVKNNNSIPCVKYPIGNTKTRKKEIHKIGFWIIIMFLTFVQPHWIGLATYFAGWNWKTIRPNNMNLIFVKTTYHLNRNNSRKSTSLRVAFGNKLGLRMIIKTQTTSFKNRKLFQILEYTFKETRTAIKPSKKPMAFISYNDKHSRSSMNLMRQSNDILKYDFDIAPPRRLFDSNLQDAEKATLYAATEEIHFLEQLNSI